MAFDQWAEDNPEDLHLASTDPSGEMFVATPSSNVRPLRQTGHIEEVAMAVRRVLYDIGEDPDRDGLADTPKRYVKAMREMTIGYEQDPADILTTSFDVPYDGMVLVQDMPFVSLCEHHMLPFFGTCTVAYIPTDRVVGLSKFGRLLDVYAKRLQVQERLTTQIADAIDTIVKPQGVGVIVKASHSCMSARGVGKQAQMVTSALRGDFLTDPTVRAEFMALR